MRAYSSLLPVAVQVVLQKTDLMSTSAMLLMIVDSIPSIVVLSQMQPLHIKDSSSVQHLK